jgi:hypothetical protein
MSAVGELIHCRKPTLPGHPLEPGFCDIADPVRGTPPDQPYCARGVSPLAVGFAALLSREIKGDASGNSDE